MPGWDDVRRIALGLPEAEQGTAYGNDAWKVRGKLFVWERPLRDSDLEALGDAAPEGPILGARVEHLVAKEALLADDSGRLLHDAALRRLSRDPGQARRDRASTSSRS